MARRSETGNVRKICGCAKWKECAHPWYVWYFEGKTVSARTGTVVQKALRCRLAPLVGREPLDYADAKAEARRAIVAWKDGLDATQLIPGDAPTLAMLLDDYNKRPNGTPIDRFQRGPIITTPVNGRPLGEWRATEITREMLEAFRRQRPKVAANRDLAVLRAAFNYAVLGGVIPSTPFKVGTVSAVKLAREEQRTRRLQGDEAERLALVAGGLADLVTAALETGCRRGELLSLQWNQVRFSPRAELFLPAQKTKAKKDRRIPISSTLRTVLERRRLDPAGEPLPADAFVLGDEIGRPRRSIKTAWRLTLKRANITGLHFHDLRREAGSRWMDAGVPLATIQRWLGHHNISQTSTYLGASHGNDERDMRAFEERIGRLLNVAESAGSNGVKPTPSDDPMCEKTEENPVVH